MMFKCLKQVNTAVPAYTDKPANTAMLANAAESTYCFANVPDQLFNRNTYRNVAEIEVIFVRVATLLGNKYARILRVRS